MPHSAAHKSQPSQRGTISRREVVPVGFFKGITMKISQIAAACLWLPGFAPEEDPNLVPGLLDAQMGPIALRDVASNAAVEATSPAKPKWPRLIEDVHALLGGSVTKFEANIEAITTLRRLESEDREPSVREREILNRYTGWGGLPQAFNLQQSDTAWRERASKLKEFLSAEEYASAMASTTDSHYTPVTVIEAMWSMVKRLGFSGGRILDPSTGTGFFLGAMPEDVASRSTVTAVEVDNVSSRIATKLYRHHGVRVLNRGFESASLPAGMFDIAISNCPFGQTKVGEVRNVPFANFSIHNYFIARSLELVRPGGLVVMVTSSFTLDSWRDGARSYFASQAELVGAIRLPASTFQKMANTSVTTDIIILKRLASTTGIDKSWTETTALPKGSPINGNPYYSSTPITLNKWLAKNPEMVIGKLSHESAAYGEKSVCMFDGDLKSALQERVERLPEGVYTPRQETQRKQRVETIRLDAAMRPGFALVDGKVCEVDGDEARPVQASEKTLARMAGMIGVRDAVRTLIAAQAENANEAMLSVYRTGLAIAYDTFVSKWGFLTDKLNRAAFKGDPDLPLLMSLEYRDDTTKTVEKAAIFTQRTVGAAKKVSRCESLQDALQVSLAESGRVIPSRIAGLVGKDHESAMRELEESGGVFLDPVTLTWIVEDAYLSGNVREKLVVAQDAGERFERNVAALEAVQPKLLTPAEITPRFGSTWIPARVYGQFLDELLGAGEKESHTVEVNLSVGTWTVASPYRCESNIAATQTYGTTRVPCGKLVELALNQIEPSVYDRTRDGKQVANAKETIAAREKQYDLKAKFKEWVWSDEERAEMLANAYNQAFNSWVVRRYNGSHLVLPGMSDAFTMRSHQKDAVWRCLSSDSNVLLAHPVGAGKTLEMICAAIELRRVGKASKPMMVVPNHLIEQVADEFMRAYPAANILMATKDDLHGEKRKTLLSRIATGNWDCVIITHASFERIPMSECYMEAYIKDELEKIEDVLRERSRDSKTNRIVKQLARAKKSWQARLKSLSADQKKDNVLTFDELGVDQLLVDESHYFKNLARFSKMERIAGLPNSDSQRAFDMFVKCRYVCKSRGDGTGIVFSTGTVITNSMAEMFVVQRFLQEATLEACGVSNFDAWAANFGETVTALELAPDGSGYRVQSRFASFVNLPDLMNMFRQVADIKTPSMLNLPVPRCREETIIADGGEALKSYVEELVERSEKIRSGLVKPKQDNMLLVTGHGRKAALDMRLVDPFAEDREGSKIALCANGVFEKWKATASFKGTQLVFCDISTPRTDGRFDAYTDLRDKLIAKGIPASEIAFIHDFTTDAAKAALFRNVRAGIVRVLMGSTDKMGVGTNVQERLCAIWHLDVPWRPSDLEQRNGRGIRQGNMCEEVQIFYMLTRASFDAYSYQLLDAKCHFIEQIMRGDSSLRVLDEDSGVLTFAEIKALASGRPEVLEKCGVDAELAKLTLVYDKWSSERWSHTHELKQMPRWIETTRQKIARMTVDAATVAAEPDDSFAFKVNGIGVVPACDAAKAFKKIIQSLPRNSGPLEMGTYRGLRMFAERDEFSEVEAWLDGSMEYNLRIGKSWENIVSSMIHIAMNLNAEVSQLQKHLERQVTRQKELEVEVTRPFDKLDRLEYLQRRKIELDTMLDLNKGEMSAVDESAEADESAVA